MQHCNDRFGGKRALRTVDADFKIKRLQNTSEYNKNVKIFFFMNVSEVFNNKHLKHLDLNKDPPNFFFFRVYFVSHRPPFTDASTRMEFFSSLIWSFYRVYTNQEII